MKKEVILVLVSILFIVILLGCNKVIYTTIYENDKSINNESRVYLIQKRDSLPIDKNIIAEIDMRENWSLDYTNLKSKIDIAVKEKGGNLLKIREFYIGKNAKGNALRILGTIYYSPENKIKEQLMFNDLLRLKGDSNISVVYIYKEDGGIPALSSPNIYANKRLVGKITNNSFLRYQSNSFETVTFSTDNSIDQKIEMNLSKGEIYYLKITKNGGVSGNGASIGVSIGGNFFKISTGEEGRFNFDNFLNKVK